MISLFALWVAERKPTRQFLFGWHRAEVIGALISVLSIWVVTGILVYVAIERILHEQYEIDSKIMLITSAFGVLVNLIMGCTLHQHSHGHDHAAADEHRGSNSINVRAAFIHVLGDFIMSTGVFIASILIYFNVWSRSACAQPSLPEAQAMHSSNSFDDLSSYIFSANLISFP
ncbi:hypothetical protein LSTR_LSTR014967 [Laodelphax striatellus]|uniref:Cation efflux protein transmembrane domain-containing protein n=1 Tax=Laodelphax striatellus TaxID=195883 RepID=A0A482XBD4_LAOST|nr:hypothetical protein LSTR_LSTR014967 [Laodelphax striatellus]